MNIFFQFRIKPFILFFIILFLSKEVLEDFCKDIGFAGFGDLAWKSNSNQPRQISTGLILRSALDNYYKHISGLDCKFTIKAPEGYSLFATVQSMDFENTSPHEKYSSYIRVCLNV